MCRVYLVNKGVTKGDRVMIYMPMIPEALVAMCAAARIGAIHCVVFGGFAGPELAKRIVDCEPKLIVSASGSKESATKTVQYAPMLEEALQIVPEAIRPKHILMKHRAEIHEVSTSWKGMAVTEEDWDSEIVDRPRFDRKDGAPV